jgi:hypothetical protein
MATSSTIASEAGVDPQRAAGREGQQHAEHRRADLLQAARERPVDGGVHGQHRRPRRQERLREAEDGPRERPRRDRRPDRLDELEGVAPDHGVAKPFAHHRHRSCIPSDGEA